MTGIDEMLTSIGNVRQSEEIPDLLARIAAQFGLKTVAYLGTGTLDRRLPKPEPHLAVTFSSQWIEN
ncbi:MAG: hypothetical protein ABIQ30_14645 [Devosia sp.]